jgi:hypothetical protein
MKVMHYIFCFDGIVQWDYARMWLEFVFERVVHLTSSVIYIICDCRWMKPKSFSLVAVRGRSCGINL